MSDELYISAVSFARPETVLAEVPLSAALSPPEVLGGKRPDQRTVLQARYLVETLNADPFLSKDAFEVTPTELAVRAVRDALKKAGLRSSELGCIIGATSTPLQTIPVESQRVGKELQVKIPAFDLHGGGADLALQVETLASWKSGDLPEYSLLVSAHAPTSRIDYRRDYQKDGIESFLFSDGAGAAILAKNQGKYRVERAESIILPRYADTFTIDLYGHLSFQPHIEEEVLVPSLVKLLHSLQPHISKDALFLESQLTPKSHTALQEAVGGSRWKTYWEDTGNMLGTTPMAALALLDEKGGEDCEQIVVLQSGIGLSVGVLVLTREG